jgi:hypothetical protein
MSNQAQSQAIKIAQSSLLNDNITIANTIALDTTVQLFNYDHSMTDIYDPSVNQGESISYHPLTGGNYGGGTYLNLHGETTTAGYVGYGLGQFFTYVIPEAGGLPNTLTTGGVCYFDENGALIYNPGISSGTPITGQVKIQNDKNSYRQFYKVLGRTAIMVNMIKIQSLQQNTSQITAPLSFVQSNILGVNIPMPLAPGAQVNEDQYSDAIITFGVNKVVNPKSGFNYKILAAGGSANSVLFSLYYTADPKVYNLQN